MLLLVAGLLLFSVVHFVPSLAPQLKQTWRSKLGEGGYMGSFSLLLIIAISLMVFGWRSHNPSLVYLPDPSLRPIGIVLMLAAMILFVASKPDTNIKRFIRHPQLSSIVVWSLAHLIMNGDSRSILLFGGMATWSILTMIFINRREGAWIKPEAIGAAADVKLIVIGGVVFALVSYAHPYIAGMPVF